MSLETGQLLNNRYRIVKILGQGGFGAVYRAWDVNLKGPCAIKENFDASEAAQNQFAREASILYNLRHPNLPKVTDHFSISEQGQYLVMEFIEGEDLQQKIDRVGGPLPEEQVLPWVIQVCYALEYLHSRNPPIIHRDIKPANIRITPEDSVYLVDFGIAKLYDPDRKTTLGARAVTPGFSPFEQYGQKPTDPRTDVYALGATLFAALTGKTPIESIERFGGGEFTSPRSQNPDISERVEGTILHAMELLPEGRFQSIQEFRNAMTGVPITHVTISSPQTKETALTQVVPQSTGQPSVKHSYKSPANFTSEQTIRKRRSWVLPVSIIGSLLLITIIALIGYFILRDDLFGVVVSVTSTGVIPTQTTSVILPTQKSSEVGVPPPISYECKDELGCVVVPRGEPIFIGYALVVSGPSESLGIDSKNGIEIAISEKGELLGHPIHLIGQDEGCNAEMGQMAGRALASNPKIVAVIGTSCSSAARTAVPILSEAGYLIVSPSNTSPDLTEPGNPSHFPGYFRTAINDLFQGATAAQYARDVLRINRAATIHDGSIYADQLQAIFSEEFRNLGGEISAQEPIDPNQTDMRMVLDLISKGEPGLVYFPVFMPAGGFIIQQARETPGLSGAHLMGADGLFTPDIVDATGEKLQGFLVSSPFVSGSRYDSFIAKYKEKFGIEPISIFHAHAYDAAMMIFSTIEKVSVQTSDETLYIPRSLLREVMYQTRDFPGVTGNLSCNPNGDCSTPSIAIYQYRAGQYPPEKIWP